MKKNLQPIQIKKPSKHEIEQVEDRKLAQIIREYLENSKKNQISEEK